jgi:hypothetical protein
VAFKELLFSTSKSVFSKLFTSLFLAASDSRILSRKSISRKFSSHFQHGKIISIRSHLDLGAFEMSRTRRLKAMFFSSP